MDRLEDVNQEELDALIATEMSYAQSAMWGDHDLNDKIDAQGFPTENPSGLLVDRRTRPNVAYYVEANGSWQPTRLKYNDHVTVLGAMKGVVAMAARSRDFFLFYSPEFYGASLVALEAKSITDRAPADPEEPPMPVIGPFSVPAGNGCP